MIYILTKKTNNSEGKSYLPFDRAQALFFKAGVKARSRLTAVIDP